MIESILRTKLSALLNQFNKYFSSIQSARACTNFFKKKNLKAPILCTYPKNKSRFYRCIYNNYYIAKMGPCAESYNFFLYKKYGK